MSSASPCPRRACLTTRACPPPAGCYTRRDRARLALILRAKAIGSPLSEIKTYLDLYGDHGEGRAQQLQYVITRTDNEITELE